MTDKPNFMVGTISYLPGTELTDRRIPMHQKQLRWLESIGINFEYYRVESAWCEKATSECTTSLNLKRMCVGAHFPGYNRNLLLEQLYKSDYDWLVCLDDDRDVYPVYNPNAFFHDLGTKPVISLAERGFLITAMSPSYTPFKRQNAEWEYRETHWYFQNESPYGFLQICFIPNLVKYGYKPVWFNGDTSCVDGEPPEDVQFELDWLLNKHGIIQNRNIVMREISQSNGDGSTIFHDKAHRQECAKHHKSWIGPYLKSKNPRNPALWTKGGLSRRVNPPFTELIPRSVPYTFGEAEKPRDKKG